MCLLNTALGSIARLSHCDCPLSPVPKPPIFKLPPELLEAIFVFASCNTHVRAQILKDLLITCKSFFASAQRLLFREITITTKKKARAVAAAIQRSAGGRHELVREIQFACFKTGVASNSTAIVEDLSRILATVDSIVLNLLSAGRSSFDFRKTLLAVQNFSPKKLKIKMGGQHASGDFFGLARVTDLGEIFGQLHKLEELEILCLPPIPKISNVVLPTLTKLTLHSCHTTAELLRTFVDCAGPPTLQILDFSVCDETEEEAVRDVFNGNGLISLRSLKIGVAAPSLYDSITSVLATFFSRHPMHLSLFSYYNSKLVESLFSEHTPEVDEKFVASIPPKIRWLSLRGYPLSGDGKIPLPAAQSQAKENLIRSLDLITINNLNLWVSFDLGSLLSPFNLAEIPHDAPGDPLQNWCSRRNIRFGEFE
ncbi:hypothetical protein BT69DRAFT_497666 [Atractiella rhizophila]|nr:hypothetical protein BT69DRAFT_497666 [Atractiella rhizophila]